MPRVSQLSAWMENRPGMLAQVADALGAKKVNIRAFMATAMDGRGFLRLVVDRPAVAKRVFAQHGWKTAADEVVEVTVADAPGALARVAERLGAAGVNIDYAYLGTARRTGKVNIYLAVRDAKAALRALR
ncbi:MAG: ACT domain-containing protein [Deltaproteobacteria bacterium]|nr:ACT domain-containing protein [Deltaproteobacteria bacterium]